MPGLSCNALTAFLHTQIALDRPQEVYMWECFADLVHKVQAGGKPDRSWPAQSALCNKLCIAVEQSAQAGCAPVDVSTWV